MVSIVLCGVTSSGFLGGCNGASEATTAEKPVARTSEKQRRHRFSQRDYQAPKTRQATEEETSVTRRVIQSQLRAFRSDDFRAAWSLLSPEMKAANGDQKRLRQLVIQRFPEFFQVARVRWLGAKADDNGNIQVKLRFIARNGHVVQTTYGLSRQKNSFLISQISLQPLNFSPNASGPLVENDALARFFRTRPNRAENQ